MRTEKQLAHLQHMRDLKKQQADKKSSRLSEIKSLDDNEFKDWLVSQADIQYKKSKTFICKATHPNTELKVVDTIFGGIHISQGVVAYTLSTGETIPYESATIT